MDIYTHRLTLWTQYDEAEIRDRLSELSHVSTLLDVDKIHAVAQARALGLSWEQIARELNITKQAAWQRWHHLDHSDEDE